MKVLVAGAGGFIGSHLVNRLKAEGHWVRGVDRKRPEFAPSAADEFQLADLCDLDSCRRAVEGTQDVYQLAADMGGIGYITANHASLVRNNMLVDGNMLEAAYAGSVGRFLYSSSACVYPSFLQDDDAATPLREQDALPADPEKGYGWEKLFMEQLLGYYREERGLGARIVRLHNVYGPYGTFEGGKEKAPAAICRKVALAVDGGTIDVWGDGRQTRSFCYVDDCIEGLLRIMASDYAQPINLGSDHLVSVNDLVDAACQAAGKRLRRRFDPAKPQGVRGRNSDNALLRQVTEWQPETTLVDGIRATYRWIAKELGVACAQ